MISHDKQFLFIDIVKTAGTSIGAALKRHGGKGKHHAIARALPAHSENVNLPPIESNEVLDNYFIFTFVRNPYDRLLSLFSYCQTAPLQKSFKKNRWKALINDSHRDLPVKAPNRETYWPVDIATFVQWLIKHEQYYCDFTGEKYIPMKDWIVNKKGENAVSYIAYYENIQDDFNVILDEIGVEPIKLPFLNRSTATESFKKAIHEIASNEELQKNILNYFREDFKFFKYSTDFTQSAAYKKGILDSSGG